MSKDPDGVIDDFDETNGLAPGLEGDADEPGHDTDDSGYTVVGGLVDELTNVFDDATDADKRADRDGSI